MLALLAVQAGRPAGALGQEAVHYVSAADGIELEATLTRPNVDGPVPAVVLLSIAGTTPLVERLVSEGFAVLTPQRRGFSEVEPLLRATYDDLAEDVVSALAFLEGLEDIDGSALTVIAQADDAPPAVLALAGRGGSIPLVLLAPPAFPGVETFRMEQRFAAERARWSSEAIDALDDYVVQIAEIALGPGLPYAREYRLNNLRAASPVQLPRSAAFPGDEQQMHFFASPFWKSRLAFDPGSAIGALESPLLVLMGAEDANTPVERYVEVMRDHLAEAPSDDVSVRLVDGRTRHTFTTSSVDIITRWLAERR
jgi:dienelactone hydrolase